MPYIEDVEKLVRGRNYKPMTADELAEVLSVEDDELDGFRANLEMLEYEGRLARAKNRYLLPSRAGLVIGRLDVARGGFGFVVPIDRKQSPSDIFIPQRDMGSATEGDVVAASVVREAGRRGQPAGRIAYVVKRHRVNFVGTYAEDGGEAKVKVDGGGAITEIRVTGTGRLAVGPGEKVVVEIESWPRAGHLPTGVVIESLGPADDPTIDTISVIREFALPEEFPQEVLAAAEAIGDAVREEDIEGRLDLRKRTVITIDPVHARDFDDAFSLKRTAEGWLLGIHIADVSAYVEPGSVIDEEAAKRGTSVYLPTKVIPMIPHAISNGIASLREGEDRLTKSVIMNYNSRGELLGYEIHKSVIRSNKRMNYEQAAAVIDGKKPDDLELSPEVEELLVEGAKLARLIEKRRREAGMLELDRPEVEVEVDSAGEVTGVKPVGREYSHKLIEMFMVAANEAVAEFLTVRNLPHLRRIHEGPDEEDLQALKVFLSGMGFVIRDVADRYQLQDILARSRGCAESSIISLAVLKSMKRAEYSPERKGHYALASKQYSHYTSPIRRFPDLIVHQVLDDYLLARMDEERKRYWQNRMPQAGLMSSMLERRADEAENELTKLKILRYLEKHADEEFQGIVTGVKEYGLFIELSDLIVDGFIHVSELPWPSMRYDAKNRRLVGGRGKGASLRLGDSVTVKIKAIDLAARKLDLAFVAKTGGPACEPGEAAAPAAGAKGGLTKKERRDLLKQMKKKPGKSRRGRR